MDLSEIRLKYIRKLTGYGAFSLLLALQDAARLGVSYSILVKEASRVKEKRIFRIKEVDFPAAEYRLLVDVVGKKFLRVLGVLF